MKQAVRALVISLFAVGASAAVVSSHAAPVFVASHQVMTATMPAPGCDPGHVCTSTNLMPTPGCSPGYPCPPKQ